MDIQKGQILTGKVTGITKFGAFVQLAPGRSGLVYISEIANTFVNNVADFLSIGQEVTVKVIGIDEQNRINLSIKQALPPKPRTEPASRPQARPPPPPPPGAHLHRSARPRPDVAPGRLPAPVRRPRGRRLRG